MDLALFDFDGTITTRGVYPDFIRYVAPPHRKIVGGLILSPLIVGFKLGLVSSPAIRVHLSRVTFWREDPDRIRRLGERFAADVIPTLVRPEAMERLEWHRARGDRIVIVSASLEAYLVPWCKTLGVELISSQIEEQDGRLTGRYLHGDCYAEEKTRRIRERYDLASYPTVYAYGDTDEDREMLELAHKRYFRWQEVRDVPIVSRTSRSRYS